MATRKIPIGNRAVTGQHGRTGERYESSLERDFLELMSADPDVVTIETQPVTITYPHSSGQTRRYTPDVRVVFHPDARTLQVKPFLLCEIKYRDEFRERFSELRERFAAARAYARQQGGRFKVYTERNIRTPRLTNERFLAGFKHLQPTHQSICEVLACLDASSPKSVAQILSDLTTSDAERLALIPTIWWLISHRKITADLSRKLTMASQIRKAVQ